MKTMLSIIPSEISPAKLQGYLQGAIAPRPIAFASTIDEFGNANLSPFSFFNIFSSNPPIVIFSPALRISDATAKHSLQNAHKTPEVAINIVNFDMVQQMSLASSEYPLGVNEFIKAGLTPVKSDLIKPWRVAESPVQLECKINQIIALGDQGGAGNLVICEILKIHINTAVLDDEGHIDQNKIDLVARMGGNFYSRVNKGLFEIAKPLKKLGIGVDSIPDFIKQSHVFSKNDLGMLGNIEFLPTTEEINIFVAQNFSLKAVLSTDDEEKIHKKAKEFLAENDILSAWKTLLAQRI